MIAIRTLGPVEVLVDGAPAPPALLWRKNLALLVYLARSPRHARTREHLIELLWGSRPEQAARHSLREALRIIRQAAGREVVLDGDGEKLHLAPESVRFDIDELASRVADGDLAGAAQLASGEFLEGFGVDDAPGFEDWLASERAAVRAQCVDVLVRHAAERERAGDLAGSMDAARRALLLEPYSSLGVQALMRAHALRGERAEALAEFDAFAKRLDTGLGLVPDEDSTRLAEQVRRSRTRQASRPLAPGTPTRRAPLTGRDRELGRLIDTWESVTRGSSAIVVIEAAAGMGRTRLLQEAGERARLAGAAVSTMRCVPADAAAPLSIVMGLASGGLLDGAGLAGAAEPALARFAQQLDDWGNRFPAARRSGEMLDPAAALTSVVCAAAAEQPVVLAIDDAQCLDDDSLGVPLALARAAARLPVLILLAALPHPPVPAIDQLRSRIGRDVPGDLLTLEPLDHAAIRALSAWAMPGWSADDVDRLARRVAADSAGSPLLAMELLHAVALGLDLSGTRQAWPQAQRTLDHTMPGELPETVVAAIRIGFRSLSRNARTVVGALAVLGGHATAATLAGATGLAGADLTEALDEAEWERWILADTRGYAFVARIARDVVSRDLVTEGQRQRYKQLS